MKCGLVSESSFREAFGKYKARGCHLKDGSLHNGQPGQTYFKVSGAYDKVEELSDTEVGWSALII